MLFFSKPKPSLADVIPGDYVDIHSHLMPGIDDGATNAQESTDLIVNLLRYGFSSFITTPHVLTGVWNNTRSNIELTEEQTRTLLEKKGITAPLKAAAEYLIDDTFLKLLKEEPLLTIKDKYVLVEMSYLNPPLQLLDIIYELRLREYKPILAHPERYLFYHGKMREYQKLKDAGCFFQVNLLSSVGYYGKGVVKATQELLDANMIDFTGSDVHHARHVAAFENKILLKDSAAFIQAIKNNSIFR